MSATATDAKAGPRRARITWALGALGLLSAALVAVTFASYRSAHAARQDHLRNTAQGYALAFESALRRFRPLPGPEVDALLDDAVGDEVAAVGLVDTQGWVVVRPRQLPRPVGADGWLRAAGERFQVSARERLGSAGEPLHDVAVPLFVGCHGEHPGRPRWGRLRRLWQGGGPPLLPPPFGVVPPLPGLPPPPLPGGGAVDAPAAPAGPMACERPRFVLWLTLDDTAGAAPVRQAQLQAALTVLALLVAWGLAFLWQRTQNRFLALQEASRRREQLAALGEMSAVLAHEIRNPLGAIRGHAQLVAERIANDERATRSCAGIVRETKRLAALVDGLLRYARPPAAQCADLDVNEAVRRVADLVAASAEAAGVAFEVELPTTPVRAHADGDALEQILLNLTQNALDAVARGGRVRIVAGPGAAGGARILVADDGPGVPPEAAERIFEPFFTTRPAGVGLGLALARQMAEAQGGTLRLLAQAEPGALFELVLPAAPRSPAALRVSPDAERDR